MLFTRCSAITLLLPDICDTSFLQFHKVGKSAMQYFGDFEITTCTGVDVFVTQYAYFFRRYFHEFNLLTKIAYFCVANSRQLIIVSLILLSAS